MLNIYKVVKLDLTSVLREIRPPELLPENHRKRGGEARIILGRLKNMNSREKASVHC